MSERTDRSPMEEAVRQALRRMTEDGTLDAAFSARPREEDENSAAGALAEAEAGIAILRAALKAIEAAVIEIRRHGSECEEERRFLTARALSVAFSALVPRSDEEAFR